jgi:hypothetical protein
MEPIIAEWDVFSAKYPGYLSEVTMAILAIERKSHRSVEKGQEVLPAGEAHLAELLALITKSLQHSPSSPQIQARFLQGLGSFQPGLESALQELRVLIANPPTESIYSEFMQYEMTEEPDDEDPEEVRAPSPVTVPDPKETVPADPQPDPKETVPEDPPPDSTS